MGILSAITGGLIGVLSDAENKKATKKATQAVQDAADKNIALARDIYGQTRTDLQPYNQAGQSSLSALMRELGLDPGPAATGAGLSGANGGLAAGGGNAGAGTPAGLRPTAANAGIDTFDKATLRTNGPNPRWGGGEYQPPTSPLEGPQAPFSTSGGPTAPTAAAPAARPTDPGYVAPTSQATPGTPDAAAYLAARPDVAQYYNEFSQTPEGQAYLQQQGVNSVEDFAAFHAKQSAGDPNATPMTTTGGTPATTDAAGRPLSGPQPERQGYTDVKMGDYGKAPDMASFFSNFEADPGAAYRRSEALSGVNAASAVRGKLRSGDAAKALATLSSNLASQEYGNWFQRQNTMFNNAQNQFAGNRAFEGNLWNQQQGRSDRNVDTTNSDVFNRYTYGTDRNDTNFEQDRGYGANRADQRTSNLFGLVNSGQNAAAQTGTAGNNFYQASASNNNNVAQTRANAAISRGSFGQNLFATGAQAAGAYFGGGGVF
jgi:hypothetical protein